MPPSPPFSHLFVKLVKKAFVVESLEHCLAYIGPEKITDQGNGVVELNPNAGDDVVAIKEISSEQKRKDKIIEIDLPDDGSDSEEESVQTLTGQDLQEGRQWYKQSWKK